MPIDAFLVATRRMLPERADMAHYREWWESLARALGSKGRSPFPEMRHVFSQQRRTEYVPIAGRHYVVVDQYLAQTLSHLNRIYHMGDGDRRHVTTYVLKLLSEQFRISGDSMEALVYAGAYWGRARELKLPSYRDWSNPGGNVHRRWWTVLHEHYVMQHELGHWVYHQIEALRGSDLGEIALDISRMVNEFLSEHTRPVDEDSTQMEEKYRKRYGDVSDQFVETISRGRALTRDVCEWYSDELREELFCDRWAANGSALFAASEMPLVPGPVVAEALFVAFLHLRFLERVQVVGRTMLGLRGFESEAHGVDSEVIGLLRNTPDWRGVMETMGDQVAAELVVEISNSIRREQIRDHLTWSQTAIEASKGMGFDPASPATQMARDFMANASDKYARVYDDVLQKDLLSELASVESNATDEGVRQKQRSVEESLRGLGSVHLPWGHDVTGALADYFVGWWTKEARAAGDTFVERTK